jgi:antitoxin component YwqK of YwqJK toxin-antitoxin module
MKTLLISCLLFLTIFKNLTLAANGGRTVGNGGDVLKCSLPLNHFEYIVLDWYEGKEISGLNINLGGPTLSLEDKLNLALKRLVRLSPKRAVRYEQHLLSFFSEVKWLTNGTLIDIPDSDHKTIPNNCQIFQIANQSPPILPTEKRYIIDQNLWVNLDDDQKAALILHEVIYREAIEIGHINSISTRVLNELIISTNIDDLSVFEFTKILKDLDFKENAIQGVAIDLDQYEFYPNGNLKTAKVIPHSTFQWNGSIFSLRDKIDFFEDGKVQTFIPSQTSTLKQGLDVFTLLPYPVQLYQNGKLKSLSLDVNNSLTHEKFKLFIHGPTTFYENGQLKMTFVESGKIVIKAIGLQDLMIKNTTTFFSNGQLKETFIDSLFSIPYSPSKTWHGSVELSQEGSLLTASLTTSIEVTLQDKKIQLSPYGKVTFWPETGKIKSAKILNPVSLYSQNNRLIKLDSYSMINLDIKERLIW